MFFLQRKIKKKMLFSLLLWLVSVVIVLYLLIYTLTEMIFDFVVFSSCDCYADFFPIFTETQTSRQILTLDRKCMLNIFEKKGDEDRVVIIVPDRSYSYEEFVEEFKNRNETIVSWSWRRFYNSYSRSNMTFMQLVQDTRHVMSLYHDVDDVTVEAKGVGSLALNHVKFDKSFDKFKIQHFGLKSVKGSHDLLDSDSILRYVTFNIYSV